MMATAKILSRVYLLFSVLGFISQQYVCSTPIGDEPIMLGGEIRDMKEDLENMVEEADDHEVPDSFKGEIPIENGHLMMGDTEFGESSSGEFNDMEHLKETVNARIFRAEKLLDRSERRDRQHLEAHALPELPKGEKAHVPFSPEKAIAEELKMEEEKHGNSESVGPVVSDDCERYGKGQKNPDGSCKAVYQLNCEKHDQYEFLPRIKGYHHWKDKDGCYNCCYCKEECTVCDECQICKSDENGCPINKKEYCEDYDSKYDVFENSHAHTEDNQEINCGINTNPDNFPSFD